jgi:hypothetical protein
MNQETLFDTRKSSGDPLMQAKPRFHGETFDAKKDGKRLVRQLDMVRVVLTGERFKTLEEISREIRDRFGKRASEASISARWRDLNDTDHYPELTGEKRRRTGADGLWEYRLTKAKGNS